jgi:hypothetical protein
MIEHSFARWTVRARIGAAIVLAGAVAVPAAAATAGEIQITGSGGCASPVHLVARNAPLSQVLDRLGGALGFEVSFESDSDPLVDVDASRPPLGLLTQLAPLENLSVAQARDPRCPHMEMVAKVWILPTGGGSAMRTAMGAPDAPLMREALEREREAQAGIDLYLASHGNIPDSNAESQPK